jgi:transposase-like protein
MHDAVPGLADLVPDLPKPRQRWTVARKATVVQAVRRGWVPLEEVCERYNISADEFFAWERNLDRYGVPGLRTTRFQIYRDTDKGRLR